MKICQKCQKQFVPSIEIDGKRRFLYKRKFCMECSPFGVHNTTDLTCSPPTSTIDKLPIEDFERLVRESTSRTDIFTKLKMRKGGASFNILNRRLKRENISVSHFITGGRTGAKGRNRLYTDNDIYVKNSTYSQIRHRVFIDKMLDYKCQRCLNDGRWMNDKITLELDHINGDRYDNRKENLRWLCPNCHSQTTTFSNKKRS